MNKFKSFNILKDPKHLLALIVSLCLLLSISGCSQKTKETMKMAQEKEKTEEQNKINPSLEADSSFLYDTSIFDLKSSAATIIDGQTVQVEGEVVGDVRTVDFEQDHFWITLEEEERNKTSTITVYCTKNTTDLIDTFGAYKRLGTTLQVRGTFNIACADHDGLSDIHAESASIKSQGAQMSSDLGFGNLAFSAVMLVFGGIMIGIYAFLSNNKRRAQEELEQDDEDDD